MKDKPQPPRSFFSTPRSSPLRCHAYANSYGFCAVNRPAVEAGLAILNAGGDFADGLIAFEGRWLGGETFVSFDKKAVSLLAQQGQPARLLA
jgi:hypothetical protein